MTVRQRRITNASPAYKFVTDAGDVWECYQWAYRYTRQLPAPLLTLEAMQKVLNPHYCWHLIRPDGAWEDSFHRMWEAKKHLEQKLVAATEPQA